jgi:hypothetical protein
MRSIKKQLICSTLILPVFLATAIGEGVGDSASHATTSTTASCDGFGPQTPRDIDNLVGENKRIFSLAPPAEQLNLCNIHFHENAEHKARDFSVFAGSGDHGGYQCGISKTLSAAELKTPKQKICGGLKPGATVEVHWVHSSCNVTPGEGLGACATDDCVNPTLRVETQVFTLVNDASAMNFNDFAFAGNTSNGYYQAKSLPDITGASVQFTGSTTGTSYDAKNCSAYEATWAVRPQCAKLDINSLGQWCQNNVFNEDHAHGVRALVTNPKHLSQIK